MKKVLIASPICKKASILKHFLDNIVKQKQENISITYYFIDDNQEEDSSVLLNNFAQNNTNTFLLKAPAKKMKYNDNNFTHEWNDYLVWRLADLKDQIINYARANDYDFLFFVDSDLILNPNTIEHLVSLNLDIVSEIFWTQWTPGDVELPQVWISDEYTLYEKNGKEELSVSEQRSRIIAFLNKIRTPGVYEVGGLGACTLISKNAISKPISFSKIKNLSFWGEDRHFCVRANALGLDLYVDNKYPALHLYRDSDLEKIDVFCAENGL